jgi:hypothetical protein
MAEISDIIDKVCKDMVELEPLLKMDKAQYVRAVCELYDRYRAESSDLFIERINKYIDLSG